MRIRCSLACLALVFAAQTARSAIVAWDASSGLYPDQVSPAFSLFDFSTGNPVLSGGELDLSTDLFGSDILLYEFRGGSLEGMGSMTINVRMRFDLGGPYVAGNPRASAGIYFATAAGAFNQLWIDQDFIFLNGPADINQVGPTATVDTNGAFHDYRIEILGNTAGSTVNVYYDSGLTPTLTGVLFDTPTATAAVVGWGDISGGGGTGSVAKWTHVDVVPEPSTGGLIALGLAPLLRRRYRR